MAMLEVNSGAVEELPPGETVTMLVKPIQWNSSLATSIAALGILWTFASYAFNRGSRYGIFVTYGSLLVLAIAPWWLRVRWRRALISSSENEAIKELFDTI